MPNPFFDHPILNSPPMTILNSPPIKYWEFDELGNPHRRSLSAHVVPNSSRQSKEET